MATPNSSPPGTIDEYIATCAPAVQQILRMIRKTIAAAAPDAQETISYRLPTFMLDGVLVHFGAFKNHIGLYPPVRDAPALEKQLARYAGPKGNLQFPLDRPIPYALIEKVVRLRVRQNRARARDRGGKR
jgi:uncharacterized protein YdhG (YjbR/CyaY superfamily)